MKLMQREKEETQTHKESQPERHRKVRKGVAGTKGNR